MFSGFPRACSQVADLGRGKILPQRKNVKSCQGNTRDGWLPNRTFADDLGSASCQKQNYEKVLLFVLLWESDSSLLIILSTYVLTEVAEK